MSNIQQLTILISAIISSALLIWMLIPFAQKLKLLHIPSHQHHHHRQATPLLGGIAIYCSALILSLVFSDETWIINLYVVAGATILLTVGVIDDIRHLSPLIRLVAQIIAATLLASGNNTEVHSLGKLFSDQEILLNNWMIPFTIFAIVGVINAFNMVDGINGLAGTLALIALGSIALVGASSSHPIYLAALIISGAIAGFLLFNLAFLGKEKIVFLGDAGSTLLGYMVAWLIIESVNDPDFAITPIGALFLIAIPVVDAIAVMTRRTLTGRSPFLADKKHLHHIVMLTGKSPTFTYLAISLIALLLAIIGVKHEQFNIHDTPLLILFLLLFVGLHFLIKSAAIKVNRIKRP